MSVEAARTLFLQGRGLIDNPARATDPDVVRHEIERLGFVQLDSINIVDPRRRGPPHAVLRSGEAVHAGAIRRPELVAELLKQFGTPNGAT
jgi:hypothetical protein